MTTYFSVDVETTGLNPFVRHHRLASVGAVAIHEDGLIADHWYDRLEFDDSWNADTNEWWQRQNAEARAEMHHERRTAPAEAAADFVQWVQEMSGDAVFVANPSTFDHAWILRWLTEADIAMPFDYRTLCLRSADWALSPAAPWSANRDGMRPQIPHHALHDAQAQGIDLLDIFNRRRQYGRSLDPKENPDG